MAVLLSRLWDRRGCADHHLAVSDKRMASDRRRLDRAGGARDGVHGVNTTMCALCVRHMCATHLRYATQIDATTSYSVEADAFSTTLRWLTVPGGG